MIWREDCKFNAGLFRLALILIAIYAAFFLAAWTFDLLTR